MGRDPLEAIADLLAERADRPLGDVGAMSGQVTASQGLALREAAGNLLGKATLAVAAGDEARAERLVARAVALPVDEHEQAEPGWWMARDLLFSTLVDAVEDADPDPDAGVGGPGPRPADESWLDCAVRLLDSSEEPVVATLVHSNLVTLLFDWELTTSEARRVRQVVGPVDRRRRPDLEPVPMPADPVPAILGVVRAVVRYRDDLRASAARGDT